MQCTVQLTISLIRADDGSPLYFHMTFVATDQPTQAAAGAAPKPLASAMADMSVKPDGGDDATS